MALTLRGIFAKRVREWRLKRRLSVRALGERFDPPVSGPFIVKAEKGDTNPTLDQVERFAVALGLKDGRRLLR